MAKNVLVGVNNVAKKPKNIYVGVDGKARRVKAAYVGVNGIAKQVWPAGVLPNKYTQLEYLDLTCYINDVAIKPVVNPRVVMEFTFVSGFDYQGTQMFLQGYTDNSYSNGPTLDYNVAVSQSYGTVFKFVYSKSSSSSSEYFKEFRSNSSEGILLDTRYKLDFLNGNNVYLYNTEGYYSIASHNLLGNFTKQTIPSVQDPYESYFRIGGVTDGYNRGHYAQCYGVQMYNGSTLIRDLYPCYNEYEYLGYYDLVDRIFFPVIRGLGSRYDITYDQALEDGYLVGPVI